MDNHFLTTWLQNTTQFKVTIVSLLVFYDEEIILRFKGVVHGTYRGKGNLYDITVLR